VCWGKDMIERVSCYVREGGGMGVCGEIYDLCGLPNGMVRYKQYGKFRGPLLTFYTV
jgi:hypothetical protein